MSNPIKNRHHYQGEIYLGVYIGTDAQWVEHSATTGAIEGPEPAPQPAYATVAEAKAAMIAWIDGFLTKVTGAVPDYERASWPSKASAARAVLAGNSAADQAAMIAAEAAVVEKTSQQVATAIAANADQYELIIASTTGLRQKIDAQLNAATDPMAYEAILSEAQSQAAAMLQAMGPEVST